MVRHFYATLGELGQIGALITVDYESIGFESLLVWGNEDEGEDPEEYELVNGYLAVNICTTFTLSLIILWGIITVGDKDEFSVAHDSKRKEAD